jgi:mycofactocin precursor
MERIDTDATTVRDEDVVDLEFEDEVLIEEVSIDGMCGVY